MTVFVKPLSTQEAQGPFSEPVSYSDTEASVRRLSVRHRPSVVVRPSVNTLTLIYVDEGFSKTVFQNSMRLGTTNI